MTIQYNEFAMAPSAPPTSHMDNNRNRKHGEYRSVPSVEAATSNFPLQSRQDPIPTVQSTPYGHATAPNARFNPRFNSNSNFDVYASKSLVPKEDTVPSLIAAGSGSTTESYLSSATSSPNHMASAIIEDEKQRKKIDQQLSLYEQPQQQRPKTTSTTTVTGNKTSQNYSITPVKDHVAKKKRRRARRRVRVIASASGGAVLGGVLLGPFGIFWGGYSAALVTHAASKCRERKKDERVAKEQLRRAPHPLNNGVLL